MKKDDNGQLKKKPRVSTPDWMPPEDPDEAQQFWEDNCILSDQDDWKPPHEVNLACIQSIIITIIIFIYIIFIILIIVIIIILIIIIIITIIIIIIISHNPSIACRT
jgi:hypothetical protein